MGDSDINGNKTKTEQLFNLLRSNNYKIDSYQYPSDLSSEQNGHFMMFLINKRIKKEDSNAFFKGDAIEIDRSILEKTNAPDLFSTTISRRQQDTATSKKAKSGVFNTLNNTRRINKVISLYMPELNIISYGLDYENIDFNFAGFFNELGSEDKASIRNAFDSETIKTDENGKISALADRIGQLALTGGFGGDLRNIKSATSKIARNPHMEFLFRGVQQRRFSFEFIFTPRSEEEAKNIYNIIKEFKLNAIPEVKDGALGVFMEFPAEFDIIFVSNGQENNYLHKLSTSALTNITINYNQAGVNSMHPELRLSDGSIGSAPTHINMRLDFAELELLSKQRIREGF